MTNHRREVPKLPQARMYLKTAQWGIDNLIEGKLSGYGFRLHLVGILASLRAVQHSLKHHDATLSADHKRIIDEWWKKTGLQTVPELKFIKMARDSILKTGAFEAYAARSEQGISTQPPREREGYERDYELAYYVQGERLDLERDIRRAIHWCDAELSAMEKHLPPVYAPE